MDRNERNRSVLKSIYERVPHASRIVRGVGVLGTSASILLTGCGTSAHEAPNATETHATTQSAKQSPLRHPEAAPKSSEQSKSTELSAATYTELGLGVAKKAINAITSQGDVITPMWGQDPDGNPGVYGNYMVGNATNQFDVGLYQQDSGHPTPELDITIGYKVNNRESFPNSPKEAVEVELDLKPTSNLIEKYYNGVTTQDILGALTDGSVTHVKEISVADFTAVKSPTDRKDANVYDLSQSSAGAPVKATRTEMVVNKIEFVPMDELRAAVGVNNAIDALTK